MQHSSSHTENRPDRRRRQTADAALDKLPAEAPRRGRQLAEMHARDELFLPVSLVLARYNISRPTLERWLRKERMGLPAPTYLGRNRYWRLSALLRWESERDMASAA